MIQSTIKFSQLGNRIDATFYKPEFIKTEKFLSNNSYTKTVGEISSKVKDGPGGWNVSKRDYTVYKDGIPFLGVSNIREGFINFEGVTRIYPAKHKELKTSSLHPGDVLLSVRGTPGFSAVVPDNLKECNISAALVLIRPQLGISSVYISFFLSSKHGKRQTERLAFKAVQADINLSEVRSIKIPIPPQPFQQHIEDLVRKSYQKREKAKVKYIEAEGILEKELGLENLDLSTQRIYYANFSEISDRIDSKYYQPKFIKIRKLLLKGKHKSVTIGEISHSIRYGTSEKVHYTNDGAPFLRVTDIDSFYTILPEEGKFITLHEAERLKEYKVKKGELIISRTGTLGSAVYINEGLDGSIFGSYFIKVSLNHEKLDPFFVAFFLNSKAGKLQSEQLASGGIQRNLTIDAIKSLIIPVLPKSTQQKISKLIQQLFKLRQESKNLIEKAKREVEGMTEKSS